MVRIPHIWTGSEEIALEPTCLLVDEWAIKHKARQRPSRRFKNMIFQVTDMTAEAAYEAGLIVGIIVKANRDRNPANPEADEYLLTVGYSQAALDEVAKH